MTGETQVTVIGNMVAPAELRFTAAGVAVANWTVASTPRQFDKGTNDWKDGATLFMRCTAWRAAAENIAESLNKGDRVIVTGRLVQRSYDAREGEKRTVVELEVEEAGPSLRYATAAPVRQGVERRPQGQQQAAVPDPWGSAPPAGGSYSDTPPF